MQQVIDFLYENELQYFSTVGLDNKPKVRPFQMMFNEGGKLFYCTGAGKSVFQELQRTPYVELCICSNMRWLRIQGSVSWVDDIAVKQRVIDSSTLVASIYHRAENPELKVFYLQKATAIFKELSGQSPQVIELI